MAKAIENFSETTPDVDGNLPNHGLIGCFITHQGNKIEFVITGFAWMGETDQWGFIHARAEGGPAIVRSMAHLTGNLKNGKPRFSEPKPPVTETPDKVISDATRGS